MKKNLIILFLCVWSLVVFLFVFVPVKPASARPLLDKLFGNSQSQSLKFTPNVSIPGSDFSKGSTLELGIVNEDNKIIEGNLAGQYIAALYKFFVGIAGIVAVVMISLGGFIWLFSGGSPDKISKAKELILGAIFGLLLALGSYLILYTINPQLVDFSLAIKQVPVISQPENKYCSHNKFANNNAENFYGDCGFAFNLSIQGLEDQQGCIFTKCPYDQICVKGEGFNNYQCRRSFQLITAFPDNTHASWLRPVWQVQTMPERGSPEGECGGLLHSSEDMFQISNSCSLQGEGARYCVFDATKKIAEKFINNQFNTIFKVSADDRVFNSPFYFALGECAF